MVLAQLIIGMVAGVLIGAYLGLRLSMVAVLDHAFAAALAAGADRSEYLMQMMWEFRKLAWARQVIKDASPSKCGSCGWMREPKWEYDKRHAVKAD